MTAKSAKIARFEAVDAKDDPTPHGPVRKIFAWAYEQHAGLSARRARYVA